MVGYGRGIVVILMATAAAHGGHLLMLGHAGGVEAAVHVDGHPRVGLGSLARPRGSANADFFLGRCPGVNVQRRAPGGAERFPAPRSSRPDCRKVLEMQTSPWVMNPRSRTRRIPDATSFRSAAHA